MKRNTMAQWMNFHQNKNFVNQTRLPLLCEKCGAILLVLVGLTAGRILFQARQCMYNITIMPQLRLKTKVFTCFTVLFPRAVAIFSHLLDSTSSGG